MLAGIVGFGAVCFVALPALTGATIGASLAVRIAVVVATMAPLGLLLGLPFPTGLRLLGTGSGSVPWMWAINAGATVLGSALATMMVMHLGFSRTILAGASVYLLALLPTFASGFRTPAPARSADR